MLPDPDTLSPTVAYIRAAKAGLVPNLTPGRVPLTGPLQACDCQSGPLLLAWNLAAAQGDYAIWSALQEVRGIGAMAYTLPKARDAANRHTFLRYVRFASILEEQADPAIRDWWRAHPLRKMYLGLE